MKCFVVFILVVLSDCNFVFASKNILFVSPLPSLSHHIFNRVLALGLVDKGYNVTFLSADLPKNSNSIKNLHYIHLEKVYEVMNRDFGGDKMLEYADMPQMLAFAALPFMCHFYTEGFYASKGLETILNYPNDFQFDVVLYDSTMGPSLLPLVTKFKSPPMVSVTAFVNSVWTLENLGGHKYPSYIPHYSLTYSTKMNYFQRLWNTLHYVADFASRDFCHSNAIEQDAREFFAFDFPPLKVLSRNTTILLVNADIAIDHPEPTPPNMILVGGLQITQPKPLPERMEKFIAAGNKGSILMSLGTNIKSSYLSNATLEVFLKTFESFPEYNFLWKFETDVENLPVAPSENVMISKFLPQNDVLAHPNIRAFVTHSGMLSTHEAYWYGVPMVCLPFFVDQHINAKKSVNFGVAVKSHYKLLTVDKFKSLIKEITSDQKYLENAEKISKLFRDKPEKPLDKAIWWIEYVMRNAGNLENLRSPTIDLGFFASNSYDVVSTVNILIYLIVFVAVFMVRKCIKKLFKSKTKSKEE